MGNLYYEAHVTLEPVFGERLEELKLACEMTGFRVAELLMRRRKEDAGERSRDDSFCTGRSKTLWDIEGRTTLLVELLRSNGFKVYRYKIEDTLVDVRFKKDGTAADDGRDKKMATQIQLNGNRVLVQVEENEKTSGGLYVPQTASVGLLVATVVGRSAEYLAGETFVKSPFAPGDRVLFDPLGATALELDGQRLLVVRHEDVVGKLVERVVS